MLGHCGHVIGIMDVSFSVSTGGIFVVMGLSGSGRAAALRTVNKLFEATAGQVWVDGIDIQALDGPDSRLPAARRSGWYSGISPCSRIGT